MKAYVEFELGKGTPPSFGSTYCAKLYKGEGEPIAMLIGPGDSFTFENLDPGDYTVSMHLMDKDGLAVRMSIGQDFTVEAVEVAIPEKITVRVLPD